MDQEDPIEKANLELLAYEIPLIFAFPHDFGGSQACPLLNTTAHPWLAEPEASLEGYRFCVSI